MITSADLDRIYKMYPRKQGKSLGYKKMSKDLKSVNDLADLERAITNYLAMTIDTEIKYVKHFSTFMNCWRDYLDVELLESELSQDKWSKVFSDNPLKLVSDASK